MELFKLLGTVVVDTAEAIKKLREASKEGEQTESKMSKAFGAIGKGAAVCGKAMLVGLGAGATAMAGLTMKAMSAAGDLEQNMGGAEQVFKSLGGSIEEMSTTIITGYDEATGKAITATTNLETVSKDAFKNMGLSQSDYLATANKMGALFKGAGFETQEALDLSSQAMQRAADVASIMGIDTEAAMEAVAGAAKGNFTMMDNLGVAMNDTAIGAYALEKGINKSTAEMTQQEKIGLAMEMFLDKTAYAAGNYAKENATLAGSLGTAKAAFQNFLAGSGDVDSLVSSFSNLANVVVKSISEIAPRLTQGLSDLVQQVVPLIPPLLNSLLPVLVDGAVTLIDGLVQALPGIISAIMAALPALIEGVVQLVIQLCAAIPQIIQPIVAALPQIVQAIIDALPTLIPALISGIIQLVIGIAQMASQIIIPLVQALPDIIVMLIDALVQNLPVLIEGAIQLIMGIVQALPQIIQALVDALPTVISLLIEAILNNLPAIIGGLVQVVVGIVAALPQILGSLISAIPAALSGIWDGISSVFSNLGGWFGEKFGAAKDAAVNAWNNTKEKFGEIKEKVVGAFNDFKDKIGTKFNDAKEKAKEKWNDAKTKFTEIKDKCAEAFSNVKDKIGDHFNDAKEKAKEKWNDAKTKFETVKDNVVSAFSNLGTKLSPLFEKAKTTAEGTWKTAKTYWERLKNGDIIGVFSDLGSKLKDKFSKALDTAKKGFDKIKQIGKDLITGLWNGISDKFTWLTNKLKSFASDVTGKLKSFFGIKSPSRVMRDEVGKYLAEGVAVGIEENTDKVESAAETMGQKLLDAAQKKLDDYSVYNELTLADEVSFWDSIRMQVEEGTDARIAADKKYFEAKKAYDEEIIASEEAVQNKINERTQSIVDSFDLFSELDKGEAVGANDILSNMDKNIKGAEHYQYFLENLRSRIGGTALFDFLQTLGVGDLRQLSVISNMSDRELSELVGKYDTLGTIARNTALSENGMPTIQSGSSVFGYNSATGEFASGSVGNSTATATSGANGDVVVYYLQKIIDILATYFPQVIETMGFDVRLDSGALVGELVSPMNLALGKLTQRKDRGR